jgi:hypothetical protein
LQHAANLSRTKDSAISLARLAFGVVQKTTNSPLINKPIVLIDILRICFRDAMEDYKLKIFDASSINIFVPREIR